MAGAAFNIDIGYNDVYPKNNDQGLHYQEQRIDPWSLYASPSIPQSPSLFFPEVPQGQDSSVPMRRIALSPARHSKNMMMSRDLGEHSCKAG